MAVVVDEVAVVAVVVAGDVDDCLDPEVVDVGFTVVVVVVVVAVTSLWHLKWQGHIGLNSSVDLTDIPPKTIIQLMNNFPENILTNNFTWNPLRLIINSRVVFVKEFVVMKEQLLGL